MGGKKKLPAKGHIDNMNLLGSGSVKDVYLVDLYKGDTIDDKPVKKVVKTLRPDVTLEQGENNPLVTDLRQCDVFRSYFGGSPQKDAGLTTEDLVLINGDKNYFHVVDPYNPPEPKEGEFLAIIEQPLNELTIDGKVKTTDDYVLEHLGKLSNGEKPVHQSHKLAKYFFDLGQRIGKMQRYSLENAESDGYGANKALSQMQRNFESFSENDFRSFVQLGIESRIDSGQYGTKDGKIDMKSYKADHDYCKLMEAIANDLGLSYAIDGGVPDIKDMHLANLSVSTKYRPIAVEGQDAVEKDPYPLDGIARSYGHLEILRKSYEPGSEEDSFLSGCQRALYSGYGKGIYNFNI